MLHFIAPVCYSTTYCGGESYGDYLLSFAQCCIVLSGMSFVSSGKCLICPKGMLSTNDYVNVVHYYVHSYITRVDRLVGVWYVGCVGSQL